MEFHERDLLRRHGLLHRQCDRGIGNCDALDHHRYSVSCTGSGGAAIASATVVVVPGGSSGLPTGSAKAAIINYPFTAHPGDVITLEGSGFGAKPTVYVQPLNSAAVQVAPKAGQDNVVVVQIPQTMAFSVYTVWVYDNVSSTSNKIALNTPQAVSI